MKSGISQEADLVRRLQAGDEKAFRNLVDTYQEKLFRLAYGIIQEREESLDIVQDVFLKVFQNIAKFKGASSLSTWLHRITVNHCLNWKRRWSRRARWRHQPLEREDGSELPDMGTDVGNPENSFRERQFSEIFQQKLKELPEQARAVFVLKELKGLSYDEIAETLGIKRGTVSSRLFYVRKRLHEALEPYK